MRVKQWQILSGKATSVDELVAFEKLINTAIAAGWQPLGGVAANGTMIAQAVVKYAKEGDL